MRRRLTGCIFAIAICVGSPVLAADPVVGTAISLHLAAEDVTTAALQIDGMCLSPVLTFRLLKSLQRLPDKILSKTQKAGPEKATRSVLKQIASQAGKVTKTLGPASFAPLQTMTTAIRRVIDDDPNDPVAVTDPNQALDTLQATVNAFALDAATTARLNKTIDKIRAELVAGDLPRQYKEIGKLIKSITKAVASGNPKLTGEQASELLMQTVQFAGYFDPADVVESFRAGVRAGDLDIAVLSVVASQQEQIRAQLEFALDPNDYAEIDTIMTTNLNLVNDMGDLREFTMTRNDPNGPVAYPFYFMVGCDGNWRIFDF